MSNKNESVVAEQPKKKFTENMAVIGSDDFPNEAIPKEKRISWIYLTVSWFGAAMFVGLYFTGVQLGTSMGTLWNSASAILVGSFFLTIFITLHGIIGQKTGCNAALTGIYAYGTRGAAIPGFHITDIGWYVVMTAQFVVIIKPFIPFIDARVLASLFAILFLTNSFIGLKQMARLNMVAMPILLFVGLYGIYRVHVTVDGGLSAVWNTTFPNTISFSAAVTMVIGTWISGASRSADYFRWAKSPKDAVIASFTGFLIGFLVCIMAGMFWGAGTGMTDIAGVLVALSIVPFGLLMFFLQTWTTNEHSGYVTSNALPVFYKSLTGKKLSRRGVTMGLALFAILISGMGIEKYFIPFISFLGVFVPVIGAVVITDYYIMSRTKYHWTGHKNFYSINVTDEDVQHHKMNLNVVPALIIGLVIGFTVSWGIPSINGLVATMIAYIISCILLSGQREKEVKKNEELAQVRAKNILL
ncbi:cytosine permease [Ureibacillus composti]|nr:cytosine permease [Ureibacillus composti]